MDKMWYLVIISCILCAISGFIWDFFNPFWGWAIIFIITLVTIELFYLLMLREEDYKGNKICWTELKVISIVAGFVCSFVLSMSGFITKRAIEEVKYEMFINGLTIAVKVIGAVVLILLILFGYLGINYLLAKKVIKKGKLKR